VRRPLSEKTAVAYRACSTERLVAVLGGAALLASASFGGCSMRPLPAEGEMDPSDPMPGGQTGACGAAAQRLELVGSPLLALDNPPANGSLYTTLLWTGEEYLFVWRIFGGDSILMQRIDASGQGVGGNIRVRPFETACDLAWGGARLAAAWSRGTGDVRDLMFQTFDGLGRPLIEPVTLRSSARIAYDGSVSYGPRIVSIPDGFAIAWSEAQVFVATVDLDGRVRQGPVAAGGREIGSLRLGLAAADDRILVGWIGRASRVDPGPSGFPVDVAQARAFTVGLAGLGPTIGLDDQAFPGGMQILATNRGFLALWSRGTPGDLQVRIAQIDPDGISASIGRMGPPVADVYRDLAPAAWNGDHLVMLWDDRPGGTRGLTLSRHTPGGIREGDPVALPTNTFAGRFYATAHDGMVGFIWSEELDRGYQVYFQQARSSSCP
jgi:hypothetical protein